MIKGTKTPMALVFASTKNKIAFDSFCFSLVLCVELQLKHTLNSLACHLFCMDIFLYYALAIYMRNEKPQR